MGLSINHPEAAELARTLAARTGESVDEAVVKALKEKLERTPDQKRDTPDYETRLNELLEIGRRCAALPDYDTRTPDEIVGYDEFGVPR